MKDLKSKLIFLKQIVTVEPLLACYIFAMGLCRPAIENLELEKSCRVNLKFNTTVCDAILMGKHGNFSVENRQVQVEISDIRSWQQPLQSVMPLILVLFLGSFSDRYKWRKPFLLIPLFGEIISAIGCILCVYFMKEWRLEVLGGLQKILPSLFGGQTMLVMASISYIADTSTVKMRTLRVGVIQIVISVSALLVQSFSGLLLLQVGYFGNFIFAIFLNVFGCCYGFYWIREAKIGDLTNTIAVVKDVFNPKHALETFNLLTTKKPENNQLHLVLALVIVFLYKSAFLGESSIMFLYTQNTFHWTPVEFGYFLSVNSLVHLVGTTLGITIFTKVFKLNDLLILLLTILNKIASNIFFGLANSVILMYTGVVVSIFTGLTRVVNRSLATKVVSENDLGKAQSLFGILEAIIPSIAIPLYNKLIYINTIEVFPPAFYFFSIILYIVCCLVVLFMYLTRQKAKNNSNKEPPTQETLVFYINVSDAAGTNK